MQELWRSSGGEQGAARFAFHPAATSLLTGAMAGTKLKLWDLENATLLWSQTHPAYTAVTPGFHPAGNQILDVSDHREDLWFFDAETGQVLRRVAIPPGQSVSADFHACRAGTLPETVIVNCCCATACLSAKDASIIWIDSDPEFCCCECLTVTRQGHAVYWSPRSTVVIRKADTGQQIREIPVPKATDEFSLNSDGTLFACVEPANRINLISLETGQLLRRIHTQYDWYSRPVWSPDDQYLAGEIDQGNGAYAIAVFESEQGNLVDQFPVNPGQESSQIEFHPRHSHQLLCGFDTGDVVLLEFE